MSEAVERERPTSWLDGRLLGVDVGRAIAIIGMFVLHTLPPGAIDILNLLADGGPQILFAVLNGIALGLPSRGVTVFASTRGPPAGG